MPGKDLEKRTQIHYWTINGQFHQYKKRAKKSNTLNNNSYETDYQTTID